MTEDILLYSKYFTAAIASFFTIWRILQALQQTQVRQKTLSTEVLRDAKATFAQDAKVEGFIKTVEKENTFKTIFGRAIPVSMTGPLMDLYNSGTLTIGQIRCLFEYAKVENGVLKVSLPLWEKFMAIFASVFIFLLFLFGWLCLVGGIVFLSQYPAIASQSIFIGALYVLTALFMTLITFDLLVTFFLLRQKLIPW